MVLKHASSILRGFASAASLILATIGSHVFLGTVLPLTFFTGAVIVIFSSFVYGDAFQDCSHQLYVPPALRGLTSCHCAPSSVTGSTPAEYSAVATPDGEADLADERSKTRAGAT